MLLGTQGDQAFAVNTNSGGQIAFIKTDNMLSAVIDEDAPRPVPPDVDILDAGEKADDAVWITEGQKSLTLVGDNDFFCSRYALHTCV